MYTSTVCSYILTITTVHEILVKYYQRSCAGINWAESKLLVQKRHNYNDIRYNHNDKKSY